MSSLWTPGGERPVGGRAEAAAEPEPERPSDEEVAARIAAMRDELVHAPADVVVANHAYGLFELAAVYLSQQPPLLPQARLAIDALGSLVEGLASRLGEAEPSLRDGLSQLRVAYVQIDGAQRGGEAAASSVGTNGDTAGTAGTSAGEAGSAGPGTSQGTGPSADAPTDGA